MRSSEKAHLPGLRWCYANFNVSHAAAAVRLARDRVALAIDGREVPVEADTLCLHGDTPGAVAMARAVREALEHAGVRVQALGR